MDKERLTQKEWRNMDPWECCGQDNYCKRGCHEEGGCNNGCIVPKIYSRLAQYEDAALAEPSDEELADAILDEEALLHMLEDIVEEQHMSADRRRLIRYTKLKIIALRQMRTEPCEWCREDVAYGEMYYHELCDGVRKKWPYCPNCGRKLGG